MSYLILILLGYLLGCSNMAYYIGKIKKLDLKQLGTGNLGASNATILMGWRAGILVGLHDIGKGVLAVFLARLLFPDLALGGAVAGVACVAGHIFPFYLGFRGGKGFATYLGLTIGLHWQFAIALLIAVVVITVVTDYVVASTMMTVVAVPPILGFLNQSWVLAAILAAASIIMVCKHWENFRRFVKGQEVGLRATIRGKHRIRS